METKTAIIRLGIITIFGALIVSCSDEKHAATALQQVKVGEVAPLLTIEQVLAESRTNLPTTNDAALDLMSDVEGGGNYVLGGISADGKSGKIVLIAFPGKRFA